MAARHRERVARLEAQRATTGAAGDGRPWTLADWLVQNEARRGLSPDERLAVQLRDDLPRWPEAQRATMARLWTQATELEKGLDDYNRTMEDYVRWSTGR